MILSETCQAQLHQLAQVFIAGASVEVPGPEDGYALLQLLEALAQVECQVALLWETKADQADLEALQDLYEQYGEQQRETIERLIAENEDLRAKLYVQDRQKKGDAHG